ncbi:hypothetical protein SAMN06296273_2168 [Nitrosomonas ureae]|uniref:Uncharacterized protein n=1 Tax=Nitrosomonas ureae TaxID=44577 RepID=A0A285C0S6_9PROT|nr:HEPN domain-containing protein [Nitrosomonas ureae]SNX60698.1 hypothetical protein SAMN06296273_2168 [Nitrosomonas ureae]
MNLKERNIRLYNALYLYTTETFGILKQKSENDSSSMTLVSKWIKGSKNNEFIKLDEQVPDYIYLLFISLIKNEHPIYQSVEEEFLKDNIWSQNHNKLIGSVIAGHQSLRLTGTLFDIVKYCLVNSNNFVLSTNDFDEIVNQYEKYFLDTKIEYVRKVPLYGINIDENINISVNANGGFSIEVLSDSEIIELIELGLVTNNLPLLQNNVVNDPPRVALVYKLKADKTILEIDNPDNNNLLSDYQNITNDWSNKQTMAASLLTILLEKSVTPVCSIERTSNSPVSSFICQSFQVPVSLRIGKEILTKDSANYFVALWEVLHKTQTSELKVIKSLKIAIRRFSLALSKSSLDDKLIDLMICAEAIFLQDGNAELGFKLAYRAALFLSKDSSEQKEMFEFFKTAYNERSKVVHGSASYEQGVKPKVDISVLENNLQKAISMMLNLAVNPKTIRHINNWEDLMFPNYSKTNA